MAALNLIQAIALTNKPRISEPSCRVGRHVAATVIQPRRNLQAWKPAQRSALISASASEQEAAAPMRAVEGDIVTIHWVCINEDGEVLESSRASDEPTTFEVGAGDIVGNRLFEAFDEVVRGMSLGETVSIRMEGGPWQEELLFKVPRDHEEVQRLEGRYKNQGGVQEGQIVQLSNGGMALVIKCDEQEVVLDANSMMAGKKMTFELELVELERPGAS